jgi:hypothetical protein
MKYLVTTRKKAIPTDAVQIVMVDGTVPGWTKRLQDLHFDHHKDGGAEVQIAEIGSYRVQEVDPDALFVTTQVDADACVAACWLQVADEIGNCQAKRLTAIAYDCDHLTVPPELSDLADFAAQAVAALKTTSNQVVIDLGLPSDRTYWSIAQKELYTSEAFKRGTEWLVATCKGDRKWPGESGEAKQYWKTVEANTQQIISQSRVSVYRDCLLFDGKGLQGKYIDPRCWLKAAQRMGLESPLAITLVQREVIVESEFKGYSYTIGCVPLHSALSELDYTKGMFDSLTAKEKELNPNADGWGGRKTVGGSGWNTPSQLTPLQVIDCVVEAIAGKFALSVVSH